LLHNQSRRPDTSSIYSSVLFAFFWSESILAIVRLIFVLVVFVLRAQAAPGLDPLSDSEKFIFAAVLIIEDSRWWEPVLFLSRRFESLSFLGLSQCFP
jgi:hypothetical protein